MKKAEFFKRNFRKKGFLFFPFAVFLLCGCIKQADPEYRAILITEFAGEPVMTEGKADRQDQPGTEKMNGEQEPFASLEQNEQYFALARNRQWGIKSDFPACEAELGTVEERSIFWQERMAGHVRLIQLGQLVTAQGFRYERDDYGISFSSDGTEHFRINILYMPYRGGKARIRILSGEEEVWSSGELGTAEEFYLSMDHPVRGEYRVLCSWDDDSDEDGEMAPYIDVLVMKENRTDADRLNGGVMIP